MVIFTLTTISFFPGDPIVLATAKVVSYTKYRRNYEKIVRNSRDPRKKANDPRLKATGLVSQRCSN